MKKNNMTFRKSSKFVNLIIAFLFVCFLTFSFQKIATAQSRMNEVKGSSSPKEKRKKGLEILSIIKKHIKRRYYDPKFKGIDVDKRFSEAKANIKKMNHNWQIFRQIAQLLLEFDDSHTRFFPPQRSTRVDYGFTMQMIGSNCFITKVTPGSDAQKKGIKPGFKINAIGNFIPTRENLWKINYLLKSLDPVKTIPLEVIDLEGNKKQINADAKFMTIEDRKALAKKRKKERKKKKKTVAKRGEKKTSNKRKDYKCVKINVSLITCKLNTFSTQKSQIREMMKQVKEHKKFILDLRGNRGGLVKIEQYLTGFFFEKKVKIGDFISRYEKEERHANPVSKKDAFYGDLIVLVDSNSASASEVFARVIQIEERGKVVGDVSAGAVMTSNSLSLSVFRGVPGNTIYTPFGLNLTVADLIMSDGKRLEKVGVIPDILIGPGSKALAERSDPVLAYAARMLGTDLDGKQTGKYRFLY